jgi:small multidrug resistance pump
MPALLPFYVALVVSILLGVSGQVLLKLGAERSGDVMAQFLSPFTIVGIGVYGLAAVFYILAIKKIPISLAFPSVSLSYVVVALIAHYFWGEPLGAPQLTGIALIAGGIFFLHQV